jgi:hypothetical protein
MLDFTTIAEVNIVEKVMFRVLVVVLLLFIAVPVQATTLVQVFPCTINEGNTEEDVAVYIAEYLKSARSIKGGADMEIYINSAVAPKSTDIEIVTIFPSFAAWGHFIDDLPGSPITELTAGAEKQGKFTCSGGKIRASVPVATEPVVTE